MLTVLDLVGQQLLLRGVLQALDQPNEQVRGIVERLAVLRADENGGQRVALVGHEIAAAEQLRADIGRLTGDLDTERSLRREAEIESAKALARLEALEPLLRQISTPTSDTNPAEAESSGTPRGHRKSQPQ